WAMPPGHCHRWRRGLAPVLEGTDAPICPTHRGNRGQSHHGVRAGCSGNLSCVAEPRIWALQAFSAPPCAAMARLSYALNGFCTEEPHDATAWEKGIGATAPVLHGGPIPRAGPRYPGEFDARSYPAPE